MTVFPYILGFIFCGVSRAKTDLLNKYMILKNCLAHFLTLYCIMLKNGQAYFKNLAVFTPQDF